MKKSKKIGLGFLLAVLVSSLVFAFYPPKTEAAFKKITYGSKTYYPIDGSLIFYGLPSPPYINQSKAGDCYGGGVVVVDSGGNTGTVYKTTNDPFNGDFVGLNTVAYGLSDKCYVADLFGQGQAVTIDDKGVAKKQAPAPEPTKTCEANFDNAFAWLICGALGLADKASSSFYSFVEGQLCFNGGYTLVGGKKVSSTGPTGIVCEGQTYLNGNVKKDWSVFKNIATGVLVIILLIAVIGQAVGSETGFLNAYTIRKILPKAVAAVILMQISWYLLKYAIDLSNDAGYAIKDLLMAPFGGAKNMNFADIVGHGVTAATGGGNAATVSFEVFSVIAGVVAFYYMIPALPLLALYVILALLVAFLTLVIRKILIIMLVILAPLAFIAWVIPGTEEYWKKWRDNFPKLLLMFPMVAALIASGRIVAYLTSPPTGGGVSLAPTIAIAHLGPLPVPYIASVTGFADLAIVIAAWFAPYYFLPKTFSWGGSMMKAAGEAVQKGATKGAKKPLEYTKGIETGWREQRKRDSMTRFKNRDVSGTYRWFKPWQKPIDYTRSGAINPLLGVGAFKVPGTDKVYEGSRRRARSLAQFAEQGKKFEDEDEAAGEAKIVDERQAHRAAGGDHDLYLQAIAEGKEWFNDPSLGKTKLGIRSKAERNAARRQLGKLGAGMNWRYLENYYEHTRRHGTAKQKAEMRKFFDNNVDTILPKLPHIYKSVSQAADADPGTIAGMHGVEVEAIIGNLSRDIETGKTFDNASGKDRDLKHEEIESRKADLTKFLGNFQRAVDNSERGGAQLESGALRAVEGFLTGNKEVLDNINFDPPKRLHGRKATGRQAVIPGEPPRDLPLVPDSTSEEFRDAVGADLEQSLAEFRRTLATKIDPSGVVRRDSNGGGGTTTTGTPQGPRIRTVPEEAGILRVVHEQPPVQQQQPPIYQPGDRFRPVAGTDTVIVVPPERRTRPPEPPATGGGPPGSPPPSGDRPFTNEDFGPDGRFPPPDIPPAA